MNELTSILNILEDYSKSPAGWLIIPIILGYLTKKYLFAGAWKSIQAILDAYFEDRKRYLEMQVKLEEQIRDLVQKFEQIAEGLWENRRLVNDRIDGFEQMQKQTLLAVEKIYAIIPKRQADYQKPETP
jgi:hypothetical protein